MKLLLFDVILRLYIVRQSRLKIIPKSVQISRNVFQIKYENDSNSTTSTGVCLFKNLAKSSRNIEELTNSECIPKDGPNPLLVAI